MTLPRKPRPAPFFSLATLRKKDYALRLLMSLLVLIYFTTLLFQHQAVDNGVLRAEQGFPPSLRNRDNKKRFASLARRSPFPKTSALPQHLPLFERIYKNQEEWGILGFAAKGREMQDYYIKKMAQEKDSVVIMEVGVWLGSSVARWLGLAENVRVIAVDPFEAPAADHKKVEVLPVEDRQNFGNPAFNRALCEYNIVTTVPDGPSRTVIFTGYHPSAAAPVFQAHQSGSGPDIDIFYLDGGKTDNAEEHAKFVTSTLNGILNEFPNVDIAGDDWSHGNHKEVFYEAVKNVARAHGRHIYTNKDWAWFMVTENRAKRYLAGFTGAKKIF